MTLACAAWREQLVAFVGCDLAPEPAAAVAAHLRECLACRREAGSLQQARRALQSLDPVAPAAIDFTAMHAAIVAAAVAPPAARPRVRWWGAAAAALAAIGLGFWWVRDTGPQALLQRPPLVQPAGLGTPPAVPWSGERMALRPLGFGGADEVGATAPGMLGRQALRTLDFTVPAAAEATPAEADPADPAAPADEPRRRPRRAGAPR